MMTRLPFLGHLVHNKKPGIRVVISSFLANKSTLEQVIKPSGIDHLDILMAGQRLVTGLKIGTRVAGKNSGHGTRDAGQNVTRDA